MIEIDEAGLDAAVVELAKYKCVGVESVREAIKAYLTAAQDFREGEENA